MTIDESVSAPARLAEADEGISEDEIRLAARNHGLPLEALRYDVTPAGLHYLLVHYDIPHLDPESWTLRIGGHVERPLRIGLDELHRRPAVTRRVTLECAGNGRALINPRPISQPWLDEAVGTAEWTGTPLRPILEEAGVHDDATEVAFTGADHGVERGVEQDYARALPLDEALRDDVLLAYEMNGHALPPQHGAPVRLLVPGWYGMTHVKWLIGIDVLDEPFDGFQNAVAYRLKHDADDPGDPVTRMLPKALVSPPGFPDFQSRVRVVERGRHELTGRAWSGWGTVVRVEISVDGGTTWTDAVLGEPRGDYAWRSWTWTWDADAPGRYELRARATDDTGRTQPVDQAWNRQGMANNHAQRVPVLVR